MLQIITGRFFGDGTVNEQEFDSIMYSNFWWIAPIPIAVGELRPSEYSGVSISSFVFRYKVKYERRRNDTLVMPVGVEAADQFRLLAGLWFKAFFHPDRTHVETLCRKTDKAGQAGRGSPSIFAGGLLDLAVQGTAQTTKDFPAFIERVLSMPRKSYRLLITCLRTFFNALEVIDSNRDLAYTMFVYCLEALAQGNDNFVPTWSDMPHEIRDGLDEVFTTLDPEPVNAIQSVLLKDRHVKLMKRFVGFIESHVADSFFTTEATGRTPGLRRSLLHSCLENLYNTRSGYVHALEPIHQHLVMAGWTKDADSFMWYNQPFLSFGGLVRLVRHVFLQFIERQERSTKEDYPEWRGEIPGIVFARIAPSNWIWNPNGFTEANATNRFSGFLECILEWITEKTPVPNMGDIMQKIEECVHQAKLRDKRPLLAMYIVFDAMAPQEAKRPNAGKVIEANRSVMNDCSIEFLVVSLLCDLGITWSVDDCEKVFDEYQKRRRKNGALILPQLLELLLMSAIANRHLEAGNRERYSVWMKRAVLDSAALTAQSYLHECSINFQPVNDERLLKGAPPAQASTSAENVDTDETQVASTG